MTAPDPAREHAAVLAIEVCSTSPEHSAGRGRHDAAKYGPCSDHERIVREVLASPAHAAVIAAAKAEAWDEGASANAENQARLMYEDGPQVTNPYRAEQVSP